MATSGLKTDFSKSINDGSEAFFELHCEVCSDEGIHREAEGYCRDCNEYLCLDCVQSHTRTRLTKHHTLDGREDMPKVKPMKSITRQSNEEVSSIPCEQHGKFIEYYCSSHEQAGCSACMTLYHGYCENIEFIPNTAEYWSESQKHKDYIRQINSIEESTNAILKMANSNNSKNETYSEDVKCSIRRYRKELNEKLNKMEDELTVSAGKIKTENSNNLRTVFKTCMNTSKYLDKTKTDIDTLITSKQHNKVFIIMTEVLEQMKTLRADLSIAEKTVNIKMYEFQPKPLLQDNPSLGEIAVHSLESVTIIPPLKQKAPVHLKQKKTVAGDIQTNQANRIPQHIKVEHITDINVATSHVEICSVNGIVMLPDKRFVITDFENDNVKLIDSKGSKVVSELKLLSYPGDVTQLRNRVAVTLPMKKKIQLLSTDGALKVVREIKVKGRCCGVTSIGDKLVVSYQFSPRLELLNEFGSVLKSITKTGIGNQKYEGPNCLAMGRDQTSIYVSDWNDDTVTWMSLGGDVLSEYRSDELSGPAGVCVDQYDFVYVCGFYSNNIHVLTSDCRPVKILLGKSDGLEKPYSLHYRVETNQLYVGTRLNKAVKVYQVLYM